jgi:hypothetical protein
MSPAADPAKALANAALMVQDDLVLMVEEEGTIPWQSDELQVLSDLNRWALSFGCRRCLSTRILAPERKVPHVLGHSAYRSRRPLLPREADEIHEPIFQDRDTSKTSHTQQCKKRYLCVSGLLLERLLMSLRPSSSSSWTTAFTGLIAWETKTAAKSLVSLSYIICPTPFDADVVAAWEKSDSTDLRVEEIHFRSERQTLRRLPRSKALLFTIRTYFEAVTVIAQEPHVPGRLAEAIRNWDDTVSNYKGKKHWENILLPYLDEQHRLQVESGVLETKEEGGFPF